MIERYIDGSSSFPHHTDPENLIESNSTVYHISVGATREIEFVNLNGPIAPVKLTVSNGDMFSMQAASEAIWSRSVLQDASIKDPRISIIFRKVCTPTPRNRPPPLGLPGCNFNIKRDILMQKHKDTHGTATTRTLFLTDSILGNIFPSSLRANSSDICIEKTIFYLTDIANYEHEFEYSKRVIISCGINDITRRYLSSEVISDVVLPQIKRFSYLYPNTTFVFITLLLTRCAKTNAYVMKLNKFLADCIRSLPNIHIFDSHDIMVKSNAMNVYSDRNGIHIVRDHVLRIKNGLTAFLRSLDEG